MTDPIADYLTRLRNAIRAGHKVVDVPGSNMKREITKILNKTEQKVILRLLLNIIRKRNYLPFNLWCGYLNRV